MKNVIGVAMIIVALSGALFFAGMQVGVTISTPKTHGVSSEPVVAEKFIPSRLTVGECVKAKEKYEERWEGFTSRVLEVGNRRYRMQFYAGEKQGWLESPNRYEFENTEKTMERVPCPGGKERGQIILPKGSDVGGGGTITTTGTITSGSIACPKCALPPPATPSTRLCSYSRPVIVGKMITSQSYSAPCP